MILFDLPQDRGHQTGLHPIRHFLLETAFEKNLGNAAGPETRNLGFLADVPDRLLHLDGDLLFGDRHVDFLTAGARLGNRRRVFYLPGSQEVG